MANLRLPFESDPDPVRSRLEARDQAGRARAVDPRFNVALEASAGTGKTRVLVDRYVNLLRAGVDPANILAMTFTRKAAAEMRERIRTTLQAAAERGEIPPSRWRELRDRLGDVAISTIDAFCLSLLREFPLEADLDPGFSVADETEVPRLVGESLDRGLRICRSLAREDEHVALVFAQLGDRRVRAGLAALLARRLVAPGVLTRYLARAPRDLTVASAASDAARRVLDLFATGDADEDDCGGESGLQAFALSGPADPAFMLLVRSLEELDAAGRDGSPDPVVVNRTLTHLRGYLLTRSGSPRTRLQHPQVAFASRAQWEAHRALVVRQAPQVADVLASWRRDLNVLVARGVLRMFRVAEAEYRRTLETHAVLDFPDLLVRTVGLLRQMEEFARSRYRLESRYHHVLVDEFQDTSRAQWELMSLLVQSWGEGAGLAHVDGLPPSIFIVGDRKQSIYAFRDADVSVLDDAARYLEGLRPDRDVRRSIARSFRSVPALLAFVNDVCGEIPKLASRRDAFRYDEQDCFPLDATSPLTGTEAIGIVAADTAEACAAAVAAEIQQLISSDAAIRDVATGVRRPVRPGDIAILFRTREGHREYEDALDARNIPAHVYKGLGFFDADEVRDVLTLLWHLAEPLSNLHAAAWLRSGFVRLSDEGLRRIGPRLADAVAGHVDAELEDHDRRAFDAARAASGRWRKLVDRMPPAELLDLAVAESAYYTEIRGRRFRQARENLKKLRSLVRRAQNKGYATLSRIVSHLDRLALGDESNAAIDAVDAVNLMTIHASKGLEFPVVFVVNIARGTGGARDAIRVAAGGSEEEASVSVGDFASESDDDAAAREREETKRLLYVALTRARDRLYLASPLREGRVQPARGSLAEVLPATLLDRFPETEDAPRWTAAPGRVHHVRRCGPAPVAPANAMPVSAGQPAPPVVRIVRPRAALPVRAAAADLHVRPTDEFSDPGHEPRHTIGEASDRLRGTLVHRMFHYAGITAAARADAGDRLTTVREQMRSLIRREERDGSLDLEEVLDRAAAAYLRLAGQPELRTLLASGETFFEVPFAATFDRTQVRGTIDLLVRHDDPERATSCGRFTVVELKTGRPRPEHHTQAATYRRAVAAMFPGAAVESRLVYLDRAEDVAASAR